jgi:hypothetical protein
METSDRSANYVPSGEGESVWLLGDLYTFKAVSEDTEGAFALWETMSPPGGAATPPALPGGRDLLRSRG